MLGRLAKLAATSAALREASITKEAGLLGAVGGAAWKFAKNNPLKATGIGLSAAFAPGAAIGKYRQNKAGFDPATQQALAGTPPSTPGI